MRVLGYFPSRAWRFLPDIGSGSGRRRLAGGGCAAGFRPLGIFCGVGGLLPEIPNRYRKACRSVMKMHENGVQGDVLNFFEEPWTRVAAALRNTRAALLPVGATEAHGPHLPLSTDIIIAEGMAAAAAETLRRRGVGSVVLPPVPFAVTYASS